MAGDLLELYAFSCTVILTLQLKNFCHTQWRQTLRSKRIFWRDSVIRTYPICLVLSSKNCRKCNTMAFFWLRYTFTIPCHQHILMFCCQLVEALSCLHCESHVLHNDLKPNNVDTLQRIQFHWFADCCHRLWKSNYCWLLLTKEEGIL